MKKEMEGKTEVEFGNGIVAAGVTTGVVIAISVPAIILTLGGKTIPGWMQGLAVIVAVLVGGAVMLTSVFFGIVIPRKVQTDGKGETSIEVTLNRKGKESGTSRKAEDAEEPQ